MPVQIRDRARYLRLERYDAHGRMDERANLIEDGDPFLTIAQPSSGTHLIVVDASPRDIELPSEKFEAYLTEDRGQFTVTIELPAGTGDEVSQRARRRAAAAPCDRTR